MDREERIKQYLAFVEDEKACKLSENAKLIQSFISFCETINIKVSLSDFDYQMGLGVLCNCENIVLKLNEHISVDKEGLVDFQVLSELFEKKLFSEGALFAPNYILFASNYFRRGFYSGNNFAPRFIEHFWKHDFQYNDVSIVLDLDRVRIDIGGPVLIEEDTWYGGKFTKEISKIKDGVSSLRPPQYLDDIELDFLFSKAYALDVYWYTYDEIKVFQALEFKQPSITININEVKYFPVRYVHAEFDMNSKVFRHFDGALQLYTEDEYFERRDNNFNTKTKGEYQVKSKSKKLFKINGDLSVEDWIKFISHFFAKNPLILEYFEGKEPDYLTPYLNAFKKSKGIKIPC